MLFICSDDTDKHFSSWFYPQTLTDIVQLILSSFNETLACVECKNPSNQYLPWWNLSDKPINNAIINDQSNQFIKEDTLYARSATSSYIRKVVSSEVRKFEVP